MCTGGCWFR
ncbi:hypothetical protein LINGRAHAP2_LOCUS16193 [Linum grandiflorum]